MVICVYLQWQNHRVLFKKWYTHHHLHNCYNNILVPKQFSYLKNEGLSKKIQSSPSFFKLFFENSWIRNKNILEILPILFKLISLFKNISVNLKFQFNLLVWHIHTHTHTKKDYKEIALSTLSWLFLILFIRVSFIWEIPVRFCLCQSVFHRSYTKIV